MAEEVVGTAVHEGISYWGTLCVEMKSETAPSIMKLVSILILPKVPLPKSGILPCLLQNKKKKKVFPMLLFSLQTARTIMVLSN